MADLVKDKPLSLTDGEVRTMNYRPFSKRNIFYSRGLNKSGLAEQEIFFQIKIQKIGV